MSLAPGAVFNVAVAGGTASITVSASFCVRAFSNLAQPTPFAPSFSSEHIVDTWQGSLLAQTILLGSSFRHSHAWNNHLRVEANKE